MSARARVRVGARARAQAAVRVSDWSLLRLTVRMALSLRVKRVKVR